MGINVNNQTEELAISLSSPDQHMAALIHEMKSPLTVILSGLSALNQVELSEKNRLRLTLALEETLRLRRMLKESWLALKYEQLNKQPLDLYVLLTETLRLMCVFPVAAKRHLRLRTNVSTVWTLGDCDHLKQVFLNLIINACEATPPGGEITCYLGVNTTTNQVYVTVQNWGDPILPERLSLLTQPFVTFKTNGTGMGLAIVKQIVENHNGHLHLASSHDIGTRVTVYLPKQSQQILPSITSTERGA